MPTIFSAIPQGVAVRRLKDTQRAHHKGKRYKFSAFYTVTKKGQVAYGNSIRNAVRNLGRDIEVAIK